MIIVKNNEWFINDKFIKNNNNYEKFIVQFIMYWNIIDKKKDLKKIKQKKK